MRLGIRWRHIQILTALLVLIAMARWVWPTPWRDIVVRGLGESVKSGRMHRITDEVRVLCADGWHALRYDPKAILRYEPFADLRDEPLPISVRDDACLTAPLLEASRSGSSAFAK